MTWDGPQVSYLEGLFLPIFERLQEHGHQFAVLQFTWGGTQKSDEARTACETVGVAYRRVDIWRFGAASSFLSAALGGRHVNRAIGDWRIDAVMARSLLPALSVLTSRLARGLPIIFDADGLPADERVEFGGLRRTSMVYRVLRAIEAQLVRRAKIVLVRTKSTIPVLVQRGGPGVSPHKFHVVTNGRDPRPFLAAEPTNQRNSGPHLCYIGSIGPQYQLRQMIELAARIRSEFSETKLSVFTGAREQAAAVLSGAGYELEGWVDFQSLQPNEVPRVLANCDIGFALRQHSLSMSAVAPIKLGDYLLAGVPVIGTPRIGPVDEVIRSGCMIAADRPIGEILDWVRVVMADRESWRARCREVGLCCFSIEKAVNEYQAAMDGLMSKCSQTPACSTPRC